jgi:hypothetical protein
MLRLYSLIFFISSVNAAHVVFKGDAVCPGNDPHLEEIYTNILCHYPLKSTSYINNLLEKEENLKGKEYCVKFMPDTFYQAHALSVLDWEEIDKLNLDAIYFIDEQTKKRYSNKSFDSKPSELLDLTDKKSESKALDFWPKLNQGLFQNFKKVQEYFEKYSETQSAHFKMWDRPIPSDPKEKNGTGYKKILDLDQEDEKYVQDVWNKVIRKLNGRVITYITFCKDWVKVIKNLEEKGPDLFLKICQYENKAESEDKLFFIRGTDGIKGEKSGVDSTYGKPYTEADGKEMPSLFHSLSFSKGLFQALRGLDFAGGSAYYLNAKYFYGTFVEREHAPSYFFCPPIHALALLKFSGEFHPRTLAYAATDIKQSYSGMFDPFPPHDDFCYRPNSEKNKNALMDVESFSNHVDWMVLNNSVSLINKEQDDIKFRQLVLLFESNPDRQAERLEAYLKILNDNQITYPISADDIKKYEKCTHSVEFKCKKDVSVIPEIESITRGSDGKRNALYLEDDNQLGSVNKI